MVTRKPKAKPGFLPRLSDAESSVVLSSLLRWRPELKWKAERAAQKLLGAVSIEDIAAAVKTALHAVDDLDNLGNRAGSHSWGYKEPSEAAMEICEEAVEKFFKDMKRRIKLGDFEGAATVCQGLVAGLHGVKGASGAVIDWAGEDTMCDLSGQAVDTFLRSIPKRSRRDLNHRFFSDEFLVKFAPSWAVWLRKFRSRLR